MTRMRKISPEQILDVMSVFDEIESINKVDKNSLKKILSQNRVEFSLKSGLLLTIKFDELGYILEPVDIEDFNVHYFNFYARVNRKLEEVFKKHSKSF